MGLIRCQFSFSVRAIFYDLSIPKQISNCNFSIRFCFSDLMHSVIKGNGPLGFLCEAKHKHGQSAQDYS